MPDHGVKESIRAIRAAGHRTGIVTDASRKAAENRLTACDLLPFLGTIVTFDCSKKKKSAPDSFLRASEQPGTLTQITLLVGDRLRHDIEPARALGMRAVYARYGDWFSTDRHVITAYRVIDGMPEPLEVLNNCR